MDYAGIAAIIVAAGGLVAAIATAAVQIIKALHENTAVTKAVAAVTAEAVDASRIVATTVQANTDDRAVKSAETNGTLAKVAAQVTDLHDVAVIGAATSAPQSSDQPVAPTG